MSAPWLTVVKFRRNFAKAPDGYWHLRRTFTSRPTCCWNIFKAYKRRLSVEIVLFLTLHASNIMKSSRIWSTLPSRSFVMSPVTRRPQRNLDLIEL